MQTTPESRMQDHAATLVWATPDADALIAKMARVSNPANEDNAATASRLIAYLIRHRHWSPFEMANLCVEVRTTRDIGRQLLRHWTLRPQEFSQRYQDVAVLQAVAPREARMQHPTNRQESVACTDQDLAAWWEAEQRRLLEDTHSVYRQALARGIAKEQARAVLMEGLTPTRLYFNGSLRSWLHFCDLRRGHGTQIEATAIAERVWAILSETCPTVAAAWDMSRQSASDRAG